MIRCWTRERSTLGDCAEQTEEVGQRPIPDQSGVMSQRLSCSIKKCLCVGRAGRKGKVGWWIGLSMCGKGEDSGRSEVKVGWSVS